MTDKKIDLELLARLKKEATKARQEADRALGAISSIEKQLLEQFGCVSVEDAQKLLTKKERELDEMKSEYERLLKQYQRDYPDGTDE